MPTAPRTAHLNPSTTVYWSDGTSVFDGYIVIGIVPPTLAGTDFASVAFGSQIMLEKLPKVYTIPIVEGKFNQNCRVFYTSDIDPPNCRYVAWLFDRNWRQVFTPVIGDAFTVTGDNFTPTYTAPTLPSTGTTIPTLN